jgi:hypothetical protein
MNRHTVRVTAQCEYIGPAGRCRRKTTITHPFCGPHTEEVQGLRVARSSIAAAGLGLHAVRMFAKGSILAEYSGERLSQEEYDARYEGEPMGTYGIEVDEGYVLDARRTDSGIARYACDYHGSGRRPNAEFVSDEGRVWIVATRTIRPGDEIFVDYGDEMHRAMGIK